MKKICISFNHFQCTDGIARSAIAISNNLVERNEIEITIRPIFRTEKAALDLLDKRIKVKPLIGFYFNGLSRLLSIVPDKLLHNAIYGRKKYDIEIGFQYGTSTRAVVATEDQNAKHYIWMHGYDEGLYMRNYYLKADAVVCVSKTNAERLINELHHDIPVHYCYNPIDEKYVIDSSMEEIEEIKTKGTVFVTVGRLSQEKGYIRLLEVIKKLKDKGYVFTVWFVGDGPQKKELLVKVHELQLDQQVVFWGNQVNPHKYTAKADIFICSSFSEGYSTACTEAIMLGVPVISTLVSGAKEIVDDAECGLVVDNSETGIYQGMKYVLDNPPILDKWKDKLKDTKIKFFSEKRINKLVDILDL